MLKSGARRSFPSLWNVVAKQGQIFGNQTKGSVARVTNGMAFSYPGYNEMLTGHPDPKIDRNEFGPNPNVTVFEWLNHMPEFRGKVAVYGTWNVFQDIFNEKRSGLVMQTGWNLPEKGKLTPRQELMDELYRTTTPLDNEDTYNSFIQVPLLDYVKTGHPRVLFVGYGETDNWAHQGRYDLVLESAHGFDHFVQQLWETMQAMPEYRDQTTFILTTDHGRGSGLVGVERTRSGRKGIGKYLDCGHGPGHRQREANARISSPVTQSQIAATVAAFLGKDYPKDVPAAAKPLPDCALIQIWWRTGVLAVFVRGSVPRRARRSSSKSVFGDRYPKHELR